MKLYKIYLSLFCVCLMGYPLFSQSDTHPYGTQLVPESNGLYIFSFDEPEKLSRPEAVCACNGKGDGWRLPTLNELQVIATQKVGLNAGNTYWTMDKVVGKLEFYAVSADDAKVKKIAYNEKNSIRCVWQYVEPTQTPQPSIMENISSTSNNQPIAHTDKTPAADQNESKVIDVNNGVVAEESKVKAEEKQNEKNEEVKEDLVSATKTYDFNTAFPYKHSLGMVFGNINGISYKTFVKDHFAIELDLAGFEVSRPASPLRIFYMGAPILNLNLLYQGHFTKGLYGIVGGGINIGYDLVEYGGKAGAGAILGLEYVFEKPVSIQFDFRPGWGVQFFQNYFEYVYYNGYYYKTGRDYYCDDIHFFDWALCFSVRYIFK